MPDPARAHQELVQALCDPGVYPRPTGAVEVLQTHISSVLLAGEFAYKLKKPFDLGFLDFTTLAARKHYCEEELRLNRRFSPDLYLGVVPITGTPQSPKLGGDGPAIEYAVKMQRFPPDSLLTEVLARGKLDLEQIDELARDVADLHARVDAAPADGRFGTPRSIHAHASQNFEQIRPLLATDAQRASLNTLARWTDEAFEGLESTFASRLREGSVRECHGDMHAGNMVIIDHRIRLFDCIEFNEAFRWIDVMSEIAFFVMDMLSHDRADIAYRFLNGYLEQAGDYAGLAVLRYYLVFRAVVRAKVAAMGASQPAISERERREAWCCYQHYIDLALDLSKPLAPLLIVMHGLSGSGKSTVAAQLAERFGAIRIRSDVERKRLFGLKALDDSASAVPGGIYTREATERTYARLHDLAHEMLRAGFSVILDATYLKRAERDAARTIAGEGRWRCIVLSCQAAPEELRRRVSHRLQTGKDAAEADLRVLEQQFQWVEPIAAEEPAVVVNTDSAWVVEALIERLNAAAARATPNKA
jgi:aminoglycoside phosphotransferase family enzyme/predicted kinase